MVGSKNSQESSPSDFNVDIGYHVMGTYSSFVLMKRKFSQISGKWLEIYPHRLLASFRTA